MTWLIYIGPTLAVFAVVFGVAAVVLYTSRVRGREHYQRVLFWGAALAAIGFIPGFVGPALLSESPQGPLLGIFITGPAGAAAGCFIGASRSIHLARQHETQQT